MDFYYGVFGSYLRAFQISWREKFATIFCQLITNFDL